MVRLSSMALLPLAAAAAVSAKTSLFLSPAQELAAPINVDFEEAGSILSHHFDDLKSGMTYARNGVWDHLLQKTAPADVKVNQRAEVERLFDGHQDNQNRLLVLMHGADQIDIVPQSVRPTHSIDVSPPPHQLDALMRDYMNTFSQTLRIPALAFSHLGSTFVNGVSDGLYWIMGQSAHVAEKGSDLVAELEFSASDSLRSELNAVHTFIERMQADKSSTDLSFQPLRFSALTEVRSTYGSQSKEYLQAKKLVASAVERVTALFQSTSEAEGRTASIAFIVTDDSPSLASFVKRSSSLNSGPAVRPAKASSTPIAKNLLATCFTSKSDLEKATNGCSGHGSAVQTSRGGKKCYRCQCTATKDKRSRKTYWAGAACQKKDVSTEFFLLGSSVILLVVITLGSVYFLFAQGSAELPGTLASVTINLK